MILRLSWLMGIRSRRRGWSECFQYATLQCLDDEVVNPENTQQISYLGVLPRRLSDDEVPYYYYCTHACFFVGCVKL